VFTGEVLYDPCNAAVSCGLSTMDHSNMLVLNYSYDLPFLRKDGRTHFRSRFGRTGSKSDAQAEISKNRKFA
jgi:hypothetical protein